MDSSDNKVTSFYKGSNPLLAVIGRLVKWLTQQFRELSKTIITPC